MRTQQSKTPLFIMAGLVTILVGNGLYLGWQQFSEWRDRKTTVKNYSEALLKMCENPAQSVAGELPYDESLKLLIVELNTDQLHVWHEEQPDNRHPQNKEEVDLVVCVSPDKKGERTSVALCQYDNGIFLDRYRYDPLVVVIDPANGEILGKITLTGAAPPQCPEHASTNSSDIEGGLPSLQALYSWLDTLPS